MLETYHGGYTKALLDVDDFFSRYSDNLVHFRCISKKDIAFVRSVLKAMIESRDSIMTNGFGLMNVTLRPDKTILIHEAR